MQVANVAGRDLLVGPESFAQLRRDLSIAFVSANVRVDGEHFVERFRVYERQLDGRTVRFGVTGVTSKSRSALEQWEKTHRLEFDDAVESARSVLDEMRAVSDVQILLAELPQRALEPLVDAHGDGYDVLITSMGTESETTPLGAAPVVLSAGSRAKRLAWVNVSVREQDVEIVGGEVLGLDEKIQDDAAMAARVAEFKERLAKAAGSDEGRVSTGEATNTAGATPSKTTQSP